MNTVIVDIDPATALYYNNLCKNTPKNKGDSIIWSAV